MSTSAFLAAARRFPPARALLRRRFERGFRTPRGAGALCGLYATFAEAERAAPKGAPLGYDQAAATAMYRDRLDGVEAKDYPVLFWLREALADARTLFDLGGHVGLLYHAYARHLRYPPGLRWTVCDVPAVAAEGAALARARGADALAFTSDPRAADGADVLLASGALQYIEEPLPRLLAGLAKPPRHLLINQTPTHAGPEFYTVQHIGVAYCAYRIADEGALPRDLRALGYELLDRWEDPSRRTQVPFDPAAMQIAYRGYCFRRR